MTFFTCLKIMYEDMECFNINPRKTYMRASSKAAKLGGTSAHIREGLRYTIYDLLVGLMLPSGNDASVVLAENFGRFLCIDNCRNSLTKLKELIERDPYSPEYSNLHIKLFIKRMNHEAAKLKMTGSCFSNSHGLSDKANKSSAQDVCRLSTCALKYPLFREIVNLVSYTSRHVFDYGNDQACLATQRWFNLNYLLKDPNKRYRGIKTG